MRAYESVRDRLNANSLKLVCGCRIWLGKTDSKGYPLMGEWSRSKKHSVNVRAHRRSYEDYHGVKLSAADEVDHLCENRACIEPLHLDVCSHKANVARYWGRRKTVC